MARERAIAIIQTLTILVFLSLGTVLTKMALSDVSPMTLAWLSVAIGMLVMSFYTFVIRRESIPRGLGRRIWWYIIAIGVCNFVIVRVMNMLSLERLEATTNTYLVNFVGFVTMGMSIFILKESPTIFQVLGAVVALVGLRVFFDEVPPAYELVGVGYVLIGIIALAYTNNIARKLAVVTNYSLSNNIISTMALLTGGSITIAIGLLADGPPVVRGAANWAIILYAGIVMTALGLTVWNYILRTLRSYEASILGASTVIWTALLAIPILGERLALNQIIGMALMILGLAVVQIRNNRLDLFLVGRGRRIRSRMQGRGEL
jgi:drug/metabolite transporter (DMT)-like permease